MAFSGFLFTTRRNDNLDWIMKRIFDSENFSKDARGSTVALGNFDGVHLGHRRIIEHATGEAKKSSTSSVIYTFDPHPVEILAPAEKPRLIQTIEQRIRSIENLHPDFCVVENFTTDFAMLTPEEFFRAVLAERLGAKAVVIGYDFTFGLHRMGTAEKLAELGKKHGVRIHVIEAQFLGETLISSTCIRSLIAGGNVKEAKELLGREYSIEGEVVAGMGIGKSLNARTANVKSINDLIPKDGVYVTKTITETAGGRETSHPSVTSIGNNPTFPHAVHTIETHLIGIDIELLGKNIRIEFLDRLRDQITFSTKKELAEQIKRDIIEGTKKML